MKLQFIWADVICDQAFSNKSDKNRQDAVQMVKGNGQIEEVKTNINWQLFSCAYSFGECLLFESGLASEFLLSSKWNILQLKSGLDSLATKF